MATLQAPALPRAAAVDAGSRDPGNRRALWLLALGAAAGLALAGWGLFDSAPARQVPPHAIALVNGKPILRADFRAQVEVLESVPFEQTTPAQRREVLDSMVEEELFVQRGLEVGLPDSDPDVRAALSNSVRLQAGVDVRASTADEAALRAFFARQPQRYGTGFEAARARVQSDFRRQQQRDAELRLLRSLSDKAALLIAPDAPAAGAAPSRP